MRVAPLPNAILRSLRRGLLVTPLLVAGCGAFFLGAKQPQSAFSAPRQPAPAFSLPDQTGKPVALTDLLHKGPVLIVFYRGHW